MALIHHRELRVEREVHDRTVPIWTAQPRPGWLPGPLPDSLRPPPDPRFVPAQPAPPEPVVDDDSDSYLED